MRKGFSRLIILFVINSILSQVKSINRGVNIGNNVTFSNYGFLLNQSPFFPIGWYDDIKPLTDYTLTLKESVRPEQTWYYHITSFLWGLIIHLLHIMLLYESI
jgi:hypothetical protein